MKQYLISAPQDRIGLSVIGSLELSIWPCMIWGRIGGASATLLATGALTCLTLRAPASPPFLRRSVTPAAAARIMRALTIMLFMSVVSRLRKLSRLAKSGLMTNDDNPRP